MPYTDAISLDDAKTYLGVDDTSRDNEISRMIGSALSFLERQTNVIAEPIDKTYTLKSGCVRVYDYPINTDDADLAATVSREDYGLYSLFTDTNTANKTITLSVGSNTIPKDYEEAAFMLIEHFFNDKEGSTTKIPIAVQMFIESNKRFIM